jgi:AcrR family transcriptional regulator
MLEEGNRALQVQRLGHDNDIPRRLIEAASEVFARHGYAGTRVREIVRAADVNLASVNYYFGGKEGLYAATLTLLAQERMAQAPAAPGGAPSPEEALLRLVRSILQRFVDTDRHSPLGRILAHESMNPTVYFDRLVTDIVRPELEQLEALVQAVAGGALDAATASRAAMSILGQCVFYLFARGAVERLHPEMLASDTLASHITTFSLAGLRGLGRLSGAAT